MQDALDYINYFWSVISGVRGELPTINGDALYVMGAITVSALFIAFFIIDAMKKTPRTVEVPMEVGPMTREEYKRQTRSRKEAEKKAIADGITDLLLTLNTKGVLSDEGYRHWHLRFGTTLNISDLLPAKLTAEQLKLAIRRRTAGTFYTPVKLPDGHYYKPPKKELNQLEKIMLAHKLSTKAA